MKEKKDLKVLHEHPDGTLSIGQSVTKLTVGEFLNLQMLMPTVLWLRIAYPRPDDITNPAYQPSVDHALFLENYAKGPSKFL